MRFELMSASEIVAARDAAPIAFVPFSPLEWHGPHLPFGTDALHAHAVALRVAEDVGGVVLPPFYLGADSLRAPGSGPESVGALGFDDDQRIVGMNLPDLSLCSLYVDEGLLALVAREIVRGLKANRFRLIVLTNGHGAPSHGAALARVALEETDAFCTVLAESVWVPLASGGPGHADRAEVEVMLAVDAGLVDLSALPAGVPLAYRDFGIVDSEAFEGRPTSDFSVAPDADPRASSQEAGEAAFRNEVARLTATVRSLRQTQNGVPAVVSSERQPSLLDTACPGLSA